MTSNEITVMIIGFLGGIGLFLYGMHTMASGLQKTSAARMKRMLSSLTKNKLLGVAVGVLVTAIIQSSSATTVMVVGFVNAGFMNLVQSVGVIMGANIGTTATSWLVASGEWSKYLKVEMVAPVAVFAGTIMYLFFKKRKITQVGQIIVGFGILFVGVVTMSSSVEGLRDLQEFQDLFMQFGSNPLLGVLVGALITAVIQSSSASVSILQTLAGLGIVPVSAAVYIIMGQNIGTCITAILSSIGTTTNAKRAATIHLLFNVIGTVIFTVIAVLIFQLFNKNLGELAITKTEISLVHTIFNVGVTLMLYPFSNLLVRMSVFLIPESASSKKMLVHLDERIIKTPSFAIENCRTETINVANLALENLKDSVWAVINRDMSKNEKIAEREAIINNVESTVTNYLIKLCNEELTDDESDDITDLLHCLTDIERVGDHCENLCEVAQFVVNEEIHFTESAMAELKETIDLAVSCYSNGVEILEKPREELLRVISSQEEDTDNLVKRLRGSHIKRLANNECSPVSGMAFLDVLTNLERITDHSLNIAQAVLSGPNKAVTIY